MHRKTVGQTSINIFAGNYFLVHGPTVAKILF